MHKMTTSLCAAFILSAGIGVNASADAGQDRATPPPPLPLEPIAFPEYVTHTLESGAEVIMVPDGRLPVVSINVMIGSGTAEDPGELVGLAEMTAEMLNKGSETRSAGEIAEAIDYLGARFSANASNDWTNIGFHTLRDHLDESLGILGEVLFGPVFPDSELETLRERMLTSLRTEVTQPAMLARRFFLREIYGDHGYGRLATPESVAAISRQDLLAFHQQHFRPDNMLIVVSGAIEPEDMRARLDEFVPVGEWGESDDAERSAPTTETGGEILLVHRHGAVQATIRAGHRIADATHPDWVTIDVIDRILGGGATSMLFRVLRDQKGYTYGAYSGFTERIDEGHFQARTEVRNEVVGSALETMLDLFAQIRDDRVSDEQLHRARDYLTGSFPLQIQTPQQISTGVATNHLLGRDPEFIESYRERVDAVTAEDVQRVARTHLRPDYMAIVIVGDATQIHDELTRIAPVRLVDVEGEPLDVEAIGVRAAEISFDPSVIEETSWTDRYLAQGNPIGEQVVEVRRKNVDDRTVFEVSGELTGMMSVETKLVFDADTFRAISSWSRQQLGPQRMTREFRLDDGSVSATIISDDETRELEVDVVEGTLLPGMETFVIMLADLEVGTKIEMPAINFEGAVYTLTIDVLEEGEVSVPAGTFEVYNIMMDQGEARFELAVTRDRPHRIVRQEFVGQPVVIERLE